MDTVDSKLEQRVWSRVMGTQNACTRLAQREAQGNARDAAIADDAALQELYTAQLRAACTYRALAPHLRGSARRTLLQLAAKKRCQANTVAALYYLRAGARPSCVQLVPPQISCAAATLCEAYREVVCTAALYRRYAQNADDLSAALLALAEETERHARQLLCVLRMCM